MSETSQPGLPANGARRQAITPAAPADQAALCAEMADLAPAIALGALEPAEAEAVERHRARCPRCARLIEEALRTAAVLPYLAKPAAPTPDIRAALFTRIAQVEQFSYPTMPRASAVPATAPAVTLPASRPIPVEERGARRRRWPASLGALGGRRRHLPGGSATSAGPGGHPARGWANWPGPVLPMTATVPLMLALFVVGGWAMTQYNRANEAAAYQDLWGTMGNFLSSEDGTVFALERAAGLPPTVTGQIIAEPDSDRAILMVWGLERADDVSYEVWIERDGATVSAGKLDVDDRGNGREMIDLDGLLRECRRVVVKAQTTAANGEPVRSDVLSTLVTPDGPATGGDGTEGEQSVGAVEFDADNMAAKD